jgi:hypothetical protein
MRKSNVVLLLACFMAVGLLLTGCGGKALSDAFDQATSKTRRKCCRNAQQRG